MRKVNENIYEEVYEYRLYKAADRKSSPEILDVLSRDPNWYVRNYVASNPSASIETLERLFLDDDFRIRDEVLHNATYIKMINNPVYIKNKAIKEGLDAIEDGLYDEGLAILSKAFDSAQVEQIRFAIHYNLSMEEIRFLANDDFNWAQMAQIRTGLEDGLSIKEVERYANQILSESEMYEKKMEFLTLKAKKTESLDNILNEIKSREQNSNKKGYASKEKELEFV